MQVRGVASWLIWKESFNNVWKPVLNKEIVKPLCKQSCESVSEKYMATLSLWWMKSQCTWTSPLYKLGHK